MQSSFVQTRLRPTGRSATSQRKSRTQGACAASGRLDGRKVSTDVDRRLMFSSHWKGQGHTIGLKTCQLSKPQTRLPAQRLNTCITKATLQEFELDSDTPTLTIRMSTIDARRCIMLDQYDNKDGTFSVYVSGVASGSEVAEAGVMPGQILRAVSDPIKKDEMWVLSDAERLRFVKDAINTTRNYAVTLVFELESKITAEMIGTATPEEEADGSGNGAADTGAGAGAVSSEVAPQVQQSQWDNGPMSQGEKERPDLYSKDWRGDEYVGSNWNELTVGLGIAILVPVLGLAFAFSTRGVLWDTVPY